MSLPALTGCISSGALSAPSGVVIQSSGGTDDSIDLVDIPGSDEVTMGDPPVVVNTILGDTLTINGYGVATGATSYVWAVSLEDPTALIAAITNDAGTSQNFANCQLILSGSSSPGSAATVRINFLARNAAGDTAAAEVEVNLLMI